MPATWDGDRDPAVGVIEACRFDDGAAPVTGSDAESYRALGVLARAAKAGSR